MRISFELDGTLLADPSIQLLASKLNSSGGFKFLWESKKPFLRPMILTRRNEDENQITDLEFKKLLDNFGFSVSDVIYTNGRPTHEFIDENGIDMHFDFDPFQVSEINNKCQGRAVLVGHHEIK